MIQANSRENLVDTALREDASVGTVERFGERSEGWVYRVMWEGRPHRLIQRLVVADVTLVSARGRGGEWQLRLLTPNREGIGRAHEIMDDLDCGDKCRSVCNLDGGGSNRSGLTDDQYEALIEAFEAGYYDIPRNVTLEEVATDLGISHQALSERFRRAYRSLVATELVTEEREY